VAPEIGQAPGAVVLRSDIVRKRRFGVEPTERFLESAYRTPVNAAVYEELARSAREIARAGYVAIVDAVFPTDAAREAIRNAALAERVPFTGVWLDAPLEVMEARLANRRGDASDATAAVLRQQFARAAAPSNWARIDASRSLDAVAAAALDRIAETMTPRVPAASAPR
jgi:predicted kinase